MKRKFNIIIWQEGDNFVTRVLENNVSSFGTTKDEALKSTYEALELYYEKEKTEDNYMILEPSLLEYDFAKVYKAVDVYKMLLSFGFQKISQKGSHIKLKNNEGLIVILPMHSKDIPYGTFLSILSQGNISQNDAKDFLGK